MYQRTTEYPVIVVESSIDEVSKEICGGDQFTISTFKSKRQALSKAKELKSFYEVHVYEECNSDVRGHWIFKQGIMTHNMFNN